MIFVFMIVIVKYYDSTNVLVGDNEFSHPHDSRSNNNNSIYHILCTMTIYPHNDSTVRPYNTTRH